MAEYINTGTASIGSMTQSTTISFEAEQSLPIEIKKSVNKPDEIYFEGDSIVFTVDLTRTTLKTVKNITLTDTIPSIVTFDPKSGITIDGFHGPVHFDSDNRVLTITDIVLNDDNPVTTVTISGEIHFT